MSSIKRDDGQMSFDSLWMSDSRAIQSELGSLCVPIYRVQLLRDVSRLSSSPYVQDSVDAAKLLSDHIGSEDREHFASLMLDAKNRVIGLHTVSIGTINAALVGPREVFKAAILANAASIIVGHNHPSGDPTPSPEDVEVTRVLMASGKLLDIPVLDHIIIGELGRSVSLQRLGLM